MVGVYSFVHRVCMRTLIVLGILAIIVSAASSFRRGTNGRRSFRPLAGCGVGLVVGAVSWPVLVIFCAVMSAHFDTEIGSDTIIFHGWGAAAIAAIFVGWALIPAGAIAGSAIGAVLRTRRSQTHAELSI